MATNTTDSAKSFFKTKKSWLILPLVLIVAFAFYKLRIPTLQNANQNEIKLAQPDVWVHSQNFALLPHDLLQVPLLKALLTEDFVYFYAQDEDWLSLQGAMRRISFEHELNWSDTLLKNIADAPADLYMWHDDSHALRYWALSMERDSLTTVAQSLAKLKLAADKQLHEIGRVSIGGDDVPVLQVSLSASRQMVFAAHGKRMVLLSDAVMASHVGEDLDDQAETLIKRLLADDANTRAEVVSEWQVIAKAQPVVNAKQTIMLSNRLFAQGYGAFIPSLRAVRFDFDGKTWVSQANVTPTAFDPKIWSHLPANAAFCASAPIDWTQVQKAVDGASSLSVKPKFAEEFASTGAVCWYAEEQDNIVQPLFVALRQPGTGSAESLNALFDWGVATNQTYMNEVRGLRGKKRQLQNELERTKANLVEINKEKIETQNAEDRAYYEKDLAGRKENTKTAIAGLEKALADIEPQISAALENIAEPAKAAKETVAEKNGTFTILSRKLAIVAESEHNPKLAFNDQAVYFSSNQDLLARAVSVGQKKYPNLAEAAKEISPTAQQFLYVSPKKLAPLLQSTAEEALPQESRAKLRAAYDYHMPARLQALAKQPAFSLTLDKSASGSGEQWLPLSWHTAE
ncbi:MAG TPA: DUF2138 family protein [Methylophilaceae bacterium]|nr:DUF2138 family protein [Methylophilaceae bacterium]